jgi:hypothetical protein
VSSISVASRIPQVKINGGGLVKKTLLTLLCLMLSSLTVLAADNGVVIDTKAKPMTAHATNPSKVRTPAEVRPAGAKTIFSNLGPTGNVYYDADGWLVAGPSSSLGESQFIGLPFTPAKNSTVTVIKTAVGYDASGANQVLITLNKDDGSGGVGAVIAKKTFKNLPDFGTCCKLNTWTLTKPAKLKAGTQYWLVASTPATGTGSDSLDVWALTVDDFFSYNVAGAGWTNSLTFTGIPAGGVFGTIP